ncbi:MAG: hypothetical protein MUE98_05100 [Rhodobacteraceae bacterium]|jgi:hypothetical protein|nr:hypothetical protein [Paracoccaceae bacterium]
MIYDSATAIARGRVRGGNVALSADFPVGATVGFAVLCGTAPGLAADAAGHDRSRVVVTELFSELKFQSADRGALERDFAGIVAAAAAGAAEQAGLRSDGACSADGGMNLSVVALFDGRLHFAGSGEGTLILARRGDIRRLDPTPPGTAAEGAIRHSGGALPLAAGDTLLSVTRRISAAEERRTHVLLARGRGQTADEVALSLLDSFVRLADPAAGETGFCVVKLR